MQERKGQGMGEERGAGQDEDAKRPRGRPRLDKAGRCVKKSISVYPKVGEFLRRLGGGVVSRGIEAASQLYQGLSEDTVQEALAKKPRSLVGIEVEKMSVSLSATTHELLMLVGEGTLSHGVKTVAEVAMATNDDQT